MPYESVVHYFYRVAQENGFTSLVYDSRCKTKADVDKYIKFLIETHK